MSFINTVETVGDAALARSIINRSITELNCSHTTAIRESAFRQSEALISVNFPNVTQVDADAFRACSALRWAEFSSEVYFSRYAFYACTSLEAVILRNQSQICSMATTVFHESAIAKGTGYIYVPKALESTYKAASGWDTYASQIRAIEDYPEFADRYSWAGVAANIADGSYANVYKVGDMVPLDLGSEGVVNMQIVAFDTDDLADGSGKAAISWVGKELLKTQHQMNNAICTTNADGTYQEGTGTIGGWEKCEMRSYLQNTILPLIPADVRSMIKPVTKYSFGPDTSGTFVNDANTTDSIWIPSYREVFGYTSRETLAPVYNECFASNTQRIKKDQSGSEQSWWLRSSGPDNTNNFAYVLSTGSSGQDGVLYAKNVAIGFCT